MRLKTIGALACAIALAGAALAQAKFGTAAEAKAMLEKAVAAVKADKTKALDLFNKGEGGFLDRDLYPFCGNVSDGKILAVANPNAKQNIGKDVRELKDATGKAYGQELFAAGQKPEGTITEVSYQFPRPGDPKPVAKVSFVTKVGDIYCGVGYYKE
jgi:signal transduction histidine kinase